MVDVTGTAGTVVSLDARSEAKVPARLHGTPGKHVVVIRTADDRVSHRVVLLKAGETARLDLSEGSAAAPSGSWPQAVAAPGPTDRQPSGSTLLWTGRMVGVGVIGAAVAATGAAVTVGIEALRARDAYNAHPTRESFDHASSMQLVTNVTWATAGLLTAGGFTLLLWPRAPNNTSWTGSVQVAPGPGGLAMRGEW